MQPETIGADASPISSLLSELLLAWTATGRGIDVPDFLRSDGAVFTSCLPAASSRAYESALARFHDMAAEDRRPLLDQLVILESRIIGTDSAPMTAECRRGVKDRAAIDAKELRERLAKLPLVVWNDPEASRATVLDMVCNKSFYGAVTLFDTGCRAARLVSKQGSSARISECGTVHLAAGGEQGTLIRASSGGASIFMAAGSDRPVMNYYAQATPDILDKLGSRIVKRGSLLPLAGKAVVIYGEPDESRKPVVSAKDYLDLMRTFHLRGERGGGRQAPKPGQPAG